MRKTNAQIELESALNWLQIYRELGIADERVEWMMVRVEYFESIVSK